MLPVIRAADAAELRGDAAEALRIIAGHLYGDDGQLFWRPERVRRLSQLVDLEGLLPRWAFSRWILAQAAQHLGGQSPRRNSQAMHVALQVQPGEPRDRSGDDQQALMVRIQDHDWVFRHVLLYELGGLVNFLCDAPSDLLAGADRIWEWATAPLGAFRFLGGSAGTLTWQRLDTGETVETLDLGSATLLVPGDCAIGRAVPVEEGTMFESAPLRVPEATALRVVGDPARWVEAVAEASRQVDRDGQPACRTGGHDFGLLTDVPVAVQQMLLLWAADRRGVRPALGPDLMVRLAVDFVRDGLQGDLDDLDDHLDPDVVDDVDVVSPWPTVAESLLDHVVRAEVMATLTPADRPRLLALARRLGGPAVAVCRQLAEQLEAAA